MNENFELTFTFKRFEGRHAILDNELTGEIKWPIKHLPEDVNPNDKVRLKLVSDKMEEAENLLALKKTLEELVN
jgi:hypothetical protein